MANDNAADAVDAVEDNGAPLDGTQLAAGFHIATDAPPAPYLRQVSDHEDEGEEEEPPSVLEDVLEQSAGGAIDIINTLLGVGDGIERLWTEDLGLPTLHFYEPRSDAYGFYLFSAEDLAKLRADGVASFRLPAPGQALTREGAIARDLSRMVAGILLTRRIARGVGAAAGDRAARTADAIATALEIREVIVNSETLGPLLDRYYADPDSREDVITEITTALGRQGLDLLAPLVPQVLDGYGQLLTPGEGQASVGGQADPDSEVVATVDSMLGEATNRYPSSRPLNEEQRQSLAAFVAVESPALASGDESMIRTEAERILALAFDPDVEQFRTAEAEAALLLERHLGQSVTRLPYQFDPATGSKPSGGDFVDSAGRVYDAIGTREFARVLANTRNRTPPLLQFYRALQNHFHKNGVDFVVIYLRDIDPTVREEIVKTANVFRAGTGRPFIILE